MQTGTTITIYMSDSYVVRGTITRTDNRSIGIENALGGAWVAKNTIIRRADGDYEYKDSYCPNDYEHSISSNIHAARWA